MEISNRYTGADLVYTSKYRDSTLLKLRTREKLHEKYGSLALSKDVPSDGEAMYIIHHPEGRPKQITWKNCKIISVLRNSDMVGHRCDALPGNSGAPIISQTRGTVVAITNAQTTAGCSGRSSNKGKIIKYVVDEIKDQVGEAVYNDITTLRRLEGPTVGNELDGKLLAIRSHNGRYISALSGNSIETDEKMTGAWNKFQFLYQNDVTYALRTHDGKYVRASATGKLDQESEIGPHQKFHLIKKGTNEYAIRTAHHYYIQANGKKLGQQFFDGSWETFSFRHTRYMF